MQTITTIGLDIAKSVFQVHGVDAAGQVVVRRQLKRRYVVAFFEKLSPCLENEIMAITGHTTSKEVVRYTRGARQKVLAAKAMARFDENKD